MISFFKCLTFINLSSYMSELRGRSYIFSQKAYQLFDLWILALLILCLFSIFNSSIFWICLFFQANFPSPCKDLSFFLSSFMGTFNI